MKRNRRRSLKKTVRELDISDMSLRKSVKEDLGLNVKEDLEMIVKEYLEMNVKEFRAKCERI